MSSASRPALIAVVVVVVVVAVAAVVVFAVRSRRDVTSPGQLGAEYLSVDGRAENGATPLRRCGAAVVVRVLLGSGR